MKLTHRAKHNRIILFFLTLIIVMLLAMYTLKILAPQHCEKIKETCSEKLHTILYFEAPNAIKSIKFAQPWKAHKNTRNTLDIYPVKLSSSLTSPLDDAIITSKFGLRTDPLDGTEKKHLGLDLYAAEGALIYAIMPGTVELAEKSQSFGNIVILSHGNNIKSLYAHCKSLNVKKGEHINRGQSIAVIGNTGYYSTGTHLHLELIINGQQYDPEPLFERQLNTNEI